MIRLKDVEMEYDNGTRAIKGITLTIEDGEFVFLVGPSGSGKSTIIKLITAEISPTRTSFISCSTSPTISGSRAEVGSSKRITSGFIAKAPNRAFGFTPTGRAGKVTGQAPISG